MEHEVYIGWQAKNGCFAYKNLNKKALKQPQTQFEFQYGSFPNTLLYCGVGQKLILHHARNF